MRSFKKYIEDGRHNASPSPKDDNPDIPSVEADAIRADGRPMYPLEERPPEAIVIHCGDPRFQTAFRRFITEELHISSYTPVIIGGGVHALSVQSFLPKNFKILWEQIKFALQDGRPRRIIIINHEDCTWYEKMSGYHPKTGTHEKGKVDLIDAGRLLLKDFAGVQVSSYWASIVDGRVLFTPVNV